MFDHKRYLVSSSLRERAKTMFFMRWGIAAAVLAGLGTSGMGLAAGQSPGGARRPATAQKRVPARLAPKAAFMYKCVMERPPGSLKWQRIPWLGDYPEAIRQARAENRPLLLWVADEDPLERC
jgi:hypothetical protein